MAVTAGYSIASISALKAISDRANGYSRLVLVDTSGKPAWYTFVSTSTVTGDDDLVVVPADNPGSGRWLKSSGNVDVRQSWGPAVELADITSISESETKEWQIRPLLDRNSLIRFLPESYATEDNFTVWRPLWVGAANEPGRWEIFNLSSTVDNAASTRYLESLEDGILSAWRFEELNRTRRDRWGSNHLSGSSGIIRTSGKIGFAAYFNGSSYLSASNTSPSLSIGEKSLKWSVFIKPESISNSTLFNRPGEYFLDINDGKFRWNVYSNSSTIVRVQDQETLQADKWYHVQCYYSESTQKIGISINNRSATEADCTSVYDSSSDSFFLGSTSTSTSFYTGIIDLLMVWRRTLTEDEKKYLYNNGDGAEVPPGVSATAIHKRDVADVQPANDQALLWEGGLNAFIPKYPPYSEALKTYENNCSLLLRFEGANNSIIFSDSAGRGYTPTLIGNPTIKTDKFKFGSSSGYFDGNSGLLYKNFQYNISTSWQIEFYISPDSDNESSTLLCIYKDPETLFRVFLDSGVLKVKYGSTAIFTGTTEIDNSEFHHVAIARSGNVTRLFLNGEIEATYNSALSLPQNNPNVAIACTGLNAVLDGFKGHIDELRLISNYSTLTAAFTPPTSQLPAPTAVNRLLDNNARVAIDLNGEEVGLRRKINLIAGSGIEIEAIEDGDEEKIDIEIVSTATDGGGGDMLKSIYDADNDGIVDNTENLQGQNGAYYRNRSNHEGTQLAITISDLVETVQDIVAALLESGTNITLSYNDITGKIAIASTASGGGGSGDMLKSIYDADNDGIVDNSENLQGQNGAYYRNRTNHEGTQLASSISDLTETVQDIVAALLEAGTNITLSYNDSSGKLNISSTASGGGGSSGDMLKSAYDTDNDGIVDNAENLGGNTPSYYRNRGNHEGTQTANTISDLVETIQDTVADLLVAGSNITLAYNDTTGKLTVASTASSGGGYSVTTVSHTTASLAPGAIENVSLALGKSFELLGVATNFPSWVRAYLTNGDRTADSSRTHTQDAADPDGLICEVKPRAGRLSLNLSPRASAYYSSAPGNIPIAIANLDTVSRAITVTFTKITYEA